MKLKAETDGLREEDVLLLRRYITAYLLHTNAQRPGPIVNMRIQEFEQSTEKSVGGGEKVKVVRVCCEGSNGGNVVFIDAIYELTRTYNIGKLCPTPATGCEELVFLTSTGAQLGGQLSKDLAEVYRQLDRKRTRSPESEQDITTDSEGRGSNEEDAMPPPKKRKGWTPAEVETIKTFFSLEKNCRPPSVAECRDLLTEFQDEDLFIARKAHEVKDKARTIIRQLSS